MRVTFGTVATPAYGSTDERHTVAGEGVNATGEVTSAASEGASTAGEVASATGEVGGIINSTLESIDTVDNRITSRAPSEYL